MEESKIIIKEDYLEDSILVSQQIPEFKTAYPKSEYNNRLNDVHHLILTAYINNKPVGFKIGYETFTKRNFYSWMGGVLKNYRKLGIADKLMIYQEQWAADNGYLRICVKTRIKHNSMIQLLDKHNYIQTGTIPCSPEEETRILYEKKL